MTITVTLPPTIILSDEYKIISDHEIYYDYIIDTTILTVKENMYEL